MTQHQNRVNIVQADFAGNYLNACGCNDTGLQADLLLNELADIINTKPVSVIQVLHDNGYDFKGSTRIELIHAVADQLHDNPQFRAAIGVLISMNNGMITYPEIVSFSDAAYADSGGEVKYLNDVTGIGSVVQGLGSIIGGIAGAVGEDKAAKTNEQTAQTNEASAKIAAAAQDDVAKEQTKQALLATLASKAETATGASGNTLLIFGLVFLLIAGGSVWYFFFRTPQAVASPATVPAV